MTKPVHVLIHDAPTGRDPMGHVGIVLTINPANHIADLAVAYPGRRAVVLTPELIDRLFAIAGEG